MNRNFYNKFHNKGKIQQKVINENNFTYRLTLQFIKKTVTSNFGLNILDYGCGVGTISFFLAKKGNNVTGVDISIDAIRLARNNSRLLGLEEKTHFVTVDTFKEEKKKEYDLIVCSEVIEHVEDDGGLLAMFNKYLVSSGILILTTPSVNAPFYRLGLANSFDKRVGHLRRYGPNSLVKMIEESGFVVNNLIKTEGILRNSLFMFPFLGKFVRFIKGPLSDLITVVDNLLVHIFGESNLIDVAKKK